MSTHLFYYKRATGPRLLDEPSFVPDILVEPLRIGPARRVGVGTPLEGPVHASKARHRTQMNIFDTFDE